MPFTSSQIEAIKPTSKVQECTIEKLGMGRGCLLLRTNPNGDKLFYFRYFVDGAKRFVLVGQFDSKGNRCWRGIRGDRLTLSAAKDGAKALADIASTHGDIDRYESELKSKRDLENRRGTLEQLLDTYIDSLKSSGRVRVKNVEGALRLHVRQAFPSLLSRRANEITGSDIQMILARLVTAGKTRQVNLVRTYLNAAFVHAARYDNDPRRIAKSSVTFDLTSNPVSLIPVITEFNRTGDRALDKGEIRRFWHALDNAPFIPATFIKLNLVIGGQRIEQLLRAEWSDYDFSGCVLTLKDGKGRPGLGVRDHLVPLTDWAIALLKPLRALNPESHPFAVSRAQKMDVGTPSKLVKKISDQLVADGLVPFRAGDLRRTCETLLASLGISKEIRAHLLSHGRSTGVQGRHYDRYTYLPEKRAVLEKWAEFLREAVEADPLGEVN